jgi:uroporphyrinogen-III synthase
MNQIAAAPVMGLTGLTVISLESRLATAMADLISRQGGTPISAPAVREIPLAENPEALEFARELLAGRIDLVILLTGVGIRTLLTAVEGTYPRAEFLAALSRIPTVVRGLKPQAVLRELGVPIALAVPDPNTWREILSAIDDAAIPLQGRRVAVQEYGRSNPELVAGLEARGASVLQVPVYRWALPEDCGPLRRAIKAIIEQQVDLVFFTTAVQIDHLLQIAAAATGGTPGHGRRIDRPHMQQGPARAWSGCGSGARASEDGVSCHDRRTSCARAAADQTSKSGTRRQVSGCVARYTAGRWGTGGGSGCGVVAGKSIPESLPPGADPVHADLDHAAGRALHAGVSGDSR